MVFLTYNDFIYFIFRVLKFFFFVAVNLVLFIILFILYRSKLLIKKKVILYYLATFLEKLPLKRNKNVFKFSAIFVPAGV